MAMIEEQKPEFCTGLVQEDQSEVAQSRKRLRAAGKKAKKAAGKANALAMKKKGVGIFAPKVLSPALATICGGKKMARTEVTKKIWAYIKKNSLNQGRTIKPESTR